MSDAPPAAAAGGRGLESGHDRYLWTLAAFAAPWVKWWFRVRLVGAERLPDGPCLVVANHNALGVADALVLAYVGSRHLPRDRFRVVVHRLLIERFPPLARVFGGLAAIPGTPASVHSRLAAGGSVLSFPGGGWDSCRPVWRAHEPEWRGRQGFARVAVAAGVPVATLAIHGSHLTYSILGGVRQPTSLTRLVDPGTHGVHLTVGGVSVAATAAAWLAGGAPTWWVGVAAAAALVPFPASVTLELLPAIDTRGLDAATVAERSLAAITAALRRGPDRRRSRPA